jgi:hypothetical protein
MTVTRDFDRISMHGVRRTLLEQQAASLGLPLYQILISKGATNDVTASCPIVSGRPHSKETLEKD